MVRLLQEFESTLPSNVKTCLEHHKEGLSHQKAFHKHVCRLVNTITSKGNPSCEDCPQLVVMDTCNCADGSVAATVPTFEEQGRTQHEKFVQDVIKEWTIPIGSPIKKNASPLLGCHGSRSMSKAAKKLSVLKSDCTLFSRLYIANQHCNGDLDEFFKYENLPFPPSLSEYGKMRLCKKSDLLVCLESSAKYLMEQP